MLANFEQRSYSDYGRVWIGRYKNLHNLAHWHIENEIIYIEKGNVTISHNDEEFTLQEGNIAFIQGGHIHYIDGEDDSIVQIMMYDSAILPEVMRDTHIKKTYLVDAYSFCNVFLQIQQEQHQKRMYYTERIHSLLVSYLIEIYRNETLKLQHDNVNNDSLQEYKQLLQNIQENYHSITFASAALDMGLSESYFSRYFHKMSGMTFSRYLNTIRIEKAIEMLKKESLTVTEISYRCGFDTIRHFNRVFKDITGITPREITSDFILYHHTTKMLLESYDPTLKQSILL